jgi:hypothetical protein
MQETVSAALKRLNTKRTEHFPVDIATRNQVVILINW